MGPQRPISGVSLEWHSNLLMESLYHTSGGEAVAACKNNILYAAGINKFSLSSVGLNNGKEGRILTQAEIEWAAGR